MVANLGFGALVIAFIVSIYGVIAAFYGARKNSLAWVESGRKAMLLTFPLISLAAISIITLLVTGQYQIQYVYSVTSNSMPLYLKITALWGGQAGSLVFWAWLMSAFASAVTLRKWERDREFLPWVIVVALVTLTFFISLILFFENPFTRLWQIGAASPVMAMFQPAGSHLYIPSDGNGLNPLLRHPGMIIHPPMLYLGFVSNVIPFAFGIAALVTGRSDDRWIRILSLGLVLGSRWAYDVLGWGGYWAWDPVEIAAFMPWLSGTAFLHSVMIQEKKGIFKRWNMILIILTYSRVIFGTFLTRSGVLSSVHAFAQSAIGPMFFGFIGITFVISLSLLLYRWNNLASEGEMTSLLSREALFLVNNLLFMGILAVCFSGVIFPLVSELFTGQKVTVGPPFYQRSTGPLFAGLLLLMGIAPLSAWGHSTAKTLGKTLWKPFLVSLLVVGAVYASGIHLWAALLGFWLCAYVVLVTLYEFYRGMMARHRRAGEILPVALVRLIGRNRRRYGGYIIHIGVILMALGVIGINMFQTQTQGTIAPGGTLQLAGYQVRFDQLDVFDTADGRNVARATLSVFKNNKLLAVLHPRQDYYYESQQSMTIPGNRSTMEDDLYIILVDWQPISSSGATFKIYHNPLVNWLWTGAFVFILGTLVAAWPDKEREPAHSTVRQKVLSAGHSHA